MGVDSYYESGNSGQERVYDNVVTVARTHYRNQRLTKTIYANKPTDDYDRVKHFNFYEREVFDFDELKSLLAKVICDQRCCLVRSIPINETVNVQRIFSDKSTSGKPTLIERPQNWYALDVDKYGEATGNIKLDTRQVVRKLPPVFRDARCIAIASSGYTIKPGIRLRLLFWNEAQITAYDLQRYFKNYGGIVDFKLFHPIQPIYVAKPVFVGRDDPVPNRMVEINLQGIATDIPHDAAGDYHNGLEKWYCKREADNILRDSLRIISETEYQGDPSRHDVLLDRARLIGKLVKQGHFDRQFARDQLMAACDEWGSDNRNTTKDADTIDDGLDRGELAMGLSF